MLDFFSTWCVILFQSRKIANALEKKKRENYQEADVQVLENLKNNMKQVWEEEKQERMKKIQKKIEISEDEVSILSFFLFFFFFKTQTTAWELDASFLHKSINI